MKNDKRIKLIHLSPAAVKGLMAMGAERGMVFKQYAEAILEKVGIDRIDIDIDAKGRD